MKNRFTLNNFLTFFGLSLLLMLVLTTKIKAATCELYPITVSQSLLNSANQGDLFSQVKNGVGTGNYSWLSWDGKNDAPSLAESLLRPGNSEIYTNPYDSNDNSIDIGDWIQGRPGVKNSAQIRTNLDALLNTPIQIPVWSSNQGQGSQFNYQVGAFATIELTDYKLNGKGWISFIYLGTEDCTGNNAPVASDAEFSGLEDSEIVIELFATDADDDVLTYTILTSPSNGQLIGDGPTYTYIPSADFIGTDAIEFIANDGTSDSNIGTVTISVLPEENSPPVAFDISLESTESTSFTFTVNASDADNDPLQYIIVSDTANGLLVGNGDDGSGPSYTYTPNAGFLGVDTFQFKANDGKDDSNIATASITIVPFANNPPVAFDANLETTESTDFEVLVTASDADDDPLTYEVVQAPTNGVLTGDGPNYVYSPNPGFVGIDNFSFIANDGQDDSNEAVVNIQVNPAANNPPIAQSALVETGESVALNITLVATDADDDPLTYQIVDDVLHGTLVGSGADYVYTPDPGYVGEDSFTFIASDGVDNSELATIEILVIESENSPPLIEPISYQVEQFSVLEFTVSAFDPDGDPLTYIIVQQPENGVVNGEGPNYIYIPDESFSGEDILLIKVNDGQVDSETVAITFFVIGDGE